MSLIVIFLIYPMKGESTIVYNFIDAFDFARAIENAHHTTKLKQKRRSRFCFSFLNSPPITGVFLIDFPYLREGEPQRIPALP